MSTPLLAIHSLFIYDWYDGPEEGAALDRHDQPVWFCPVATDKFAVVREAAYLLRPLPRQQYDDLVAKYGAPPIDGLVFEPGPCDLVDKAIKAGQKIQAGTVVFADYRDFTFKQEVSLTQSQVEQLLAIDLWERFVEKVL